RFAKLELGLAAEQQRSLAPRDLADVARAVMCYGTQRDRRDGAVCRLEDAAREVVRSNRTQRAGLVLTLLYERLGQSGDVRDFTAAPESEQVDEVRPDRAQYATAARCIEPPAPRRFGGLRPAVAPQVGFERQLHVPQLANRVRPNQLVRAASVGLIAQFVVNPGQSVWMLFGCCHHLRGLKRVDSHRFFAQHVLPG